MGKRNREERGKGKLPVGLSGQRQWCGRAEKGEGLAGPVWLDWLTGRLVCWVRLLLGLGGSGPGWTGPGLD